MDDVFAIQNEIARQIVAALRINLTDGEQPGATERPVNSVVGYDCYRRHAWRQRAHALDRGTDGAKIAIHPGLAEGFPLMGRPDDALHWTRIAIDRSIVSYPFLSPSRYPAGGHPW